MINGAEVKDVGEKKVVGRNVVITVGIIATVLLGGLVGVIADYTSITNDKDSQILTLMNQKNQLQTWLDGNKTLLNETQAWLQGNITYYNSQTTALQNRIGDLNAQVTALEGEVAALQTQYQKYVTAYHNLRDKVNQRWDEVNVEPFITPTDSDVRDVVYQITGGWSNPSDFNEYWSDVKAMYDWVVNNVDYRYDGLTPMLPYDPSGNLQYCSDMWQFPNETLSLRKGDCEDQTILLCSMIRCYNNMSYAVECVCLSGAAIGHVGVQIPVSGNKLVILDPAGHYYSHDLWGNIVYNDITTEINNWLNYWKPTMGQNVYVNRVFSDYIDKTFSSTGAYIAWMYSK